MIHVLKRSGRREALDLEKWQKQVQQICNGVADVLSEDNDTNHYVYVYYREHSSKYGEIGSPYYIGIGKNKRAWTKGKDEVGMPTNTKFIVLEKTKISSSTAKRIEIALITHFGRIDIGTGILRNKTEGGDGCRLMGEKNPMFGKIGNLHHLYGKKRPDVAGENNPMFGKRGENHPAYGYKHTIEDINAIKQSKLGVKRIGFDQSGSKNPMYGRTGDKHPMFGKKQKKQKCIACGKMISKGMFTRWHLDGKCQHKNKKA